MKSQNIFFIYLLFNFIVELNCVMVVLGPTKKSFCALKHFVEDNVLKLSYVVSGENENIVKAVIKNPSDVVIFVKENDNNGNFQMDITETGNFSLCFSIQVEQDCVVSFEYINHLEVVHITKLAKDDVFNNMNKNLTDISTMFDNIEQALKFYAERSDTHNKSIIKHI